ncbi:MAG: asparagine synthetase B, partial [Desulfobaccales bacterium]
DEAAKRCLLARDPCGIKPLYYSDEGGTLRFASQVKALLAGGGLAPGAEPAGHVGFFLWGWVPEPYTLYPGVAGPGGWRHPGGGGRGAAQGQPVLQPGGGTATGRSRRREAELQS